MNTINRKKAQLSVAVVAALAIFAVAAVMLLTGSFATGPAQATGPGEPPKLCGPGQSLDNYPDEPAEKKSSGHYRSSSTPTGCRSPAWATMSRPAP